MLDRLTANWWALGLRGVAAVVFGLAALAFPGMVLMVMILLFAAYALVDGIFTVITAFRTADWNGRSWLFLMEGVAGLTAGLLTFLWPGLTALALLYLIAAWAIVTGILRLITAIWLPGVTRGLLVSTGVLSLAFGVLMAAFPGEGALALVQVIAVFAVLLGLLLTFLAFSLRGWQRDVRMRAQHL